MHEYKNKMIANLDITFACMCIVMAICLFFNVTSTFAGAASTNATSAYYSLRQDLRSREAIKEQVPPGGGLTPVTVQFDLIPLDILDVDDAKQVVSLTAGFSMNWTDVALAWDSSETGPYPGVHQVQLPLSELWKPVLFFANGADKQRGVELPDSALVTPSGNVRMAGTWLLQFTCDMDHRTYPFDTQQCTLIAAVFSSITIRPSISGNAMEIRKFVSYLLNSGEWELQDFNASSIFFDESTDGYVVQYTSHLKRRTTFYIFSFVGPVVMTSYMNTLVFAMPAESQERVSYLVSIFVSNAVFVGFCVNEMPQGLNRTPLVMYLLLGIMIESGLLVIVVSFLARYSYGLRINDVNPAEVGETSDAPLEIKQKAGVVKPKKVNRDLLCFVATLSINTLFVVGLLLAII